MDKVYVYKLIKHLIDQIGETQFYFMVPAHNDETVVFEIFWKRKNKLPWSFSLYHADNFTECSTLDILDALEEIEIDMVDFKTQVINKILTQTAYMDMRIKEARKLLGSDVIDNSIREYEEFGKNLLATISMLLGDKKKSNLTLVKD